MRYRLEVRFGGKWIRSALRPFASHDAAAEYAARFFVAGLWRVRELPR